MLDGADAAGACVASSDSLSSSLTTLLGVAGGLRRTFLAADAAAGFAFCAAGAALEGTGSGDVGPSADAAAATAEEPPGVEASITSGAGWRLTRGKGASSSLLQSSTVTGERFRRGLRCRFADGVGDCWACDSLDVDDESEEYREATKMARSMSSSCCSILCNTPLAACAARRFSCLGATVAVEVGSAAVAGESELEPLSGAAGRCPFRR